MRKKQILLTLSLATFITLSFYACKKDSVNSETPCSESASKTNVRIKNNSKYNFSAVVLNPSSGLINCGDIKKGEKNCYHSFDLAYSNAYIKFYVEDKEFVYQPIDYVGEVPLGIGKFTYVLDISDFNARTISLTLHRD